MNASAVRRCANAYIGQPPWDAAQSAELRSPSGPPERFVRKAPEPPKLPALAWINQPKEVYATAQ
jgi:hypothetical protein